MNITETSSSAAPWRFDPQYGGMSDLSAKKSYEAAERRRIEDDAFAREQAQQLDEMVQRMERNDLRTTKPSPDPKLAPLKLTFFEDCGTFAKKRWIVKGVIARGETSAWVGPPGSGKSALLTEIAVHCASGRSWRGHRAKEACGVLILALERADLFRRRLHVYQQRGSGKLPIAVAGDVIDLMKPTCVELIASTVRAAEGKFGRNIGLVVIDTYNKGIAAGDGDEDKARDQNRAAANLRKVQELLGVHIALVGHTGKNEDRGARGSNAHLGDVDLMVQIGGNDTKLAKITKGNDQPEGDLTQFKLQAVELGLDEDEEPITTAIVSPDVIDEPPVRNVREPKLTPNQATMFRLLHEAGRGGLSTADWNAKAREVDIGTKRKATLNDIQSRLKELKMVREYNGTWTVDHRS